MLKTIFKEALEFWREISSKVNMINPPGEQLHTYTENRNPHLSALQSFRITYANCILCIRPFQGMLMLMLRENFIFLMNLPPHPRPQNLGGRGGGDFFSVSCSTKKVPREKGKFLLLMTLTHSIQGRVGFLNLFFPCSMLMLKKLLNFPFPMTTTPDRIFFLGGGDIFF